jgi:hypothetical protein
MSALPVVPLPSDTVTVGDSQVTVFGLSRSAVLHLQSFDGDYEAVDCYLLAQGCQISEEEAKAWSDSTPADAVEPVVARIVELSGLATGAQKSS